MAGRDTFSIIVGLAVDRVPTLGIVYLPAREELFYAQRGKGAFQVIGERVQSLKIQAAPSLAQARLSVRIPTQELRSIEKLLAQIPTKQQQAGGSLGSRICDIAAGRSDVMVNTNPRASKWDTLGAEVILTEAGGTLLNLKGQRLDYAQPSSKWNELFVAAGSDGLARELIKMLS